MKQWAEIKKKLLSDKKLIALIAVFAVGLVLFALSGTSASKKTKAADDDAARWAVEQSLEERAQKLLSTVEGVGKVKVLITLDRLQEYRYAQNAQTEGENDKTKQDYVIVEKSGEKTGLILTVVSPKVRGVAVTCEGGNSARVRQEVINLICAAFDVSAADVYVSAYTGK